MCSGRNGHCGFHEGQTGKKPHIYIHNIPKHLHSYIDTWLTHKHSDTVHMDSSLESATTTSTTLLLVNLEASFTGVTWLRRCHSPTNQYHSESSGSTGGVHTCVCVCGGAGVCVRVYACDLLKAAAAVAGLYPSDLFTGQ